MTSELRMFDPLFVFTLDTDFVPQFMLEHALNMLREHDVPATVSAHRHTLMWL
ncbi:MAG: hypothetical protein LBR94_06210 [Desulfovibrio sp.]|jgi:peptidoglycan/xylan/chitin deacetylase (PgdA/CDA1 family)|nr:hypothetical protein [Desulfovibrio sp.]